MNNPNLTLRYLQTLYEHKFFPQITNLHEFQKTPVVVLIIFF